MLEPFMVNASGKTAPKAWSGLVTVLFSTVELDIVRSVGSRVPSASSLALLVWLRLKRDPVMVVVAVSRIPNASPVSVALSVLFANVELVIVEALGPASMVPPADDEPLLVSVLFMKRESVTVPAPAAAI